MKRYALLTCLSLVLTVALAAGDSKSAVANMHGAKGNDMGKVELTQTPEGVLLQADLTGIPAGMHAIHIHETGKCDGPDFKSAGGHFNPEKASHGYLQGKDSHAGDMPNFQADSSGKVHIEIMNSDVTLESGKPNSLTSATGTAVVVHSGADDYKSQPSGAAGDRIACGVIMAAK